MPKVLRLFDLGSYCHAGAVNKRAFIEGPIVQVDARYTQRTLMAGGTSLLFNHLYTHYGACDMLFCADRNPTIKKGMYADYKVNRDHAIEIEKQKEICERILKNCGFTVLYEEGYEADDFIYSAVEKYKSVYDEIVIHTVDSDLYFCICDNVSIGQTHSRSKDITREQYEYRVKKDDYTPYNMSTFFKIINGDVSDCIPPLDPILRTQMLRIFDNDGVRHLLGNKSYVREMTELLCEEALPQVDLVFPLDVSIPDEIGEGIKSKILAWGYLMKNNNFYEMVKPTTDIEDEIETMCNDGLYTD